MKVIDILNKMANYEKMPECIKVSDEIYKYYPAYKDYLKEDTSKWFISDFVDCYSDFNKEVEIIKNTPQEDKKIEKLNIEIQDERTGNVYIRNELGKKCYLTKHSKIIANKINEIIDTINGEKK